jgi:hypothetical protein
MRAEGVLGVCAERLPDARCDAAGELLPTLALRETF